jgi:hypothetical protein
MRNLIAILLLSFFSLQTFATGLVLIPTKSFDETQHLFKNPSITVHFYRDDFVIATLEGALKDGFVLLDKNPHFGVYSYYIVYVDQSVEKTAYLSMISGVAEVLYDDGSQIFIKTNENDFGQLHPAKNDGMVRIYDREVKLPETDFFTTATRFDPDPFIVSLLDEVSGPNITAVVQHLEDYGTRNAYTPESLLAQNWIKEQFEAMNLPVELMDFTMPGGPASDNVIATLEGTTYPDEYVVIGGHYDSYSYSGLAPGADDNASGTSGVMEVARILSQYDFDRTIIFCAFSGEEYGLYGSAAYAARCAQQGMNIHGYLNMDMIGYLQSGSYIHTDMIYPASAQPLADYYEMVCGVYLPDFVVEQGTLVGGDSDHTSFNNNGYMGIFPFEDSQNYSPHIHSSNDLVGPSYNNEEQAAEFTKAILATAVSMANRTLPPQNLTALPGDQQVALSWDQMFDIDYFNIYRDDLIIDTTTANSYEDNDVQNGNQYSYYITAIYSGSGDESEPSNLVSVTPMPPLSLPLLLDFENGAPYWDFEGTWGISNQASHSPTHSITESPAGDYQNDLDISATLTPFSLAGYSDAGVSFWAKWDLETNYDYMWLEITTNGSNWTELDEFNGLQNSWVNKSYPLTDYLGQNYVQLRFRFYSDFMVTGDGMFIDDFDVTVEGGMMTQSISLPAGWSGISSYLAPENTEVEDMLASIADDVIIVQDMENVWWPAQNINTIGNWNSHSGYKIKMANETMLEIAGYNEAEKTLELAEGWNLMPVLSAWDVACDDIFENVMDQIIIVKDIAGVGVYWPSEDIQTLSYLTSSKAYMVKTNAPITISFEGIAPAQIQKSVENNASIDWNIVAPTGNSHLIAIPHDLLAIFEEGDQIGVFNGSGWCTGMFQIDNLNQNVAVVISGNDSVTEDHDGMVLGEIINFKLFRASNNQEYNLIAGFDDTFPSQNVYENEGLSKLNQLEFDNTGIREFSSNISIYPNPAKNRLQIDVSQSDELSLELFNLKGQLMMQKQINGPVKIQMDDFSRGVYTLKLSGNNFFAIEKLILH